MVNVRYTVPMAKIKITQVRSRIHCTKKQKLNLDALGLRRLNATVEHEATPQILGMVNQVKHLLKVTNI
jgi:large subunit ribosomal protein L30